MPSWRKGSGKGNVSDEGVDLLSVYVVSVVGAYVFTNLLWLVAQHIVQRVVGYRCYFNSGVKEQEERRQE